LETNMGLTMPGNVKGTRRLVSVTEDRRLSTAVLILSPKGTGNNPAFNCCNED